MSGVPCSSFSETTVLSRTETESAIHRTTRLRRVRYADVVLLLHITTTANVADVIEVEGFQLKVTGVSASYDGVGKLSHYVIEAMRWK